MDSTWLDYYSILELEFGCSQEEIKKSYRRLQKKYHPDSEFADETKSQEINEAYSVLGNPEKRDFYDSTYFEYKNGEFENNQAEEMPKYTHEEMHEAFTEEEIRFARKVALQTTISETIENAKIIIDAKNELLFAAFNDEYDEQTYLEEYTQFCTITNEFISNLNDLIQDAEEFSLNSEINTINQVIDFLIEVMESIPTTLSEAKHKAKLEIMTEQLQSEAEEVISNARSVREEFISLYAQVYRDNISESDFRMYYRILRLGVTDALSQLSEIYDLLKKAKLDDTFKIVGELIGKLSQDLKLYSGDYKVAQTIGEREDLKERIKNRMLSYEEYKAKMLNIMQEVIGNPTIENAQLRVTEGRALTDDFQSKFAAIDKKDYKKTVFLDLAKDTYDDAIKIYKKRKKMHEVLSSIFARKTSKTVSENYVEYLTENVELAEEEINALKLLHKVYILLGKHNEYEEITRDDLNILIQKVNGYINKSEELQNYLESMLEYIKEITENYNQLDLDSINQSDINCDDLKSSIVSYECSAFFLQMVNYTLITGVMSFALIAGFLDSGNLPANLTIGALISAGIYIQLNKTSKSYYNKSLSLGKDLKVYRQTEAYNNLMGGNDPHLDKIYQKALKI